MINTMIREAAVILFFTLLAAVGTHFLHPKAPSWYLNAEPVRDDEVSLADIAKHWHGDVLWIDARPRAQYDADHVPGALLINEQEVDRLMFDSFEKLQSNTKPVVIYCSSASCDASHRMKDYLTERVAMTNVYVLRGGWAEWMKRQGMSNSK
jgi:rhodanese-related sulfurtransferase